MHRDLKLGLALAVLLIGSTAAFFFRNDSDPDAGLPQLKDAAVLDGLVAERAVTPYLGAPAPSPHATAHVNATSPWAKPAFLETSSAAMHNVAITPDPIQMLTDEDFEPTAATKPAISAAPAITERDADGTAIHIVQSGDTLSGIAARYLGSIARFNDIFELNRDQIKDPHDLKIGMRLRLPSAPAIEAPAANAIVQSPPSDGDLMKKASLVTRTPEETTTNADQTPAAVEGTEAAAPPETPSAEGLFKAAKRTPFVPSRYRAPKLTK